MDDHKQPQFIISEIFSIYEHAPLKISFLSKNHFFKMGKKALDKWWSLFCFVPSSLLCSFLWTSPLSIIIIKVVISSPIFPPLIKDRIWRTGVWVSWHVAHFALSQRSRVVPRFVPNFE